MGLWRMSSIGLLCVLGVLLCVCRPPGCLAQGQGRPQGQVRGQQGGVRRQAGGQGRGQAAELEEELREQDALCFAGGCYVVYFQRKTFRESLRSCKDKGGNLATVRNEEEAGVVHELLSSVETRGPRTRLRLWIGLQRQPRQCSSTRPLRGFTWVSGEPDGEYTDWLRADPPGSCAVPRCVAISVNTAEEAREQHDNFRWLDGACALAVDGFLCLHSYRGMCHPLEAEGGGAAVYTTPLGLVSTLLTFLPYGSVGTLPCPPGAPGPSDQSVLCTEREDGGVGWSQDGPLCSMTPQDFCGEDNGGCEHYCQNSDTDFYCTCSEGFSLASDETSCLPHASPTPDEDSDPATDIPDQERAGPSLSCSSMGCESSCEQGPRGIRCTCHPGFLLGRDGRSCVDVDECSQAPCPQTCFNLPGTFECGCHQGYEQDQEGECVCARGYEPNKEGECVCRHGFQPNREGECVDIDECLTSDTCQHMCLNYVGGFECYCRSGFKLLADLYSCRPLPEDYDSSTTTTSPLTPELDDDPGYNPDLGHDPNSLEWHTNPPSDELLPLSTQTSMVHYEHFTMPGAGAGAGDGTGAGVGAGTWTETGAVTGVGTGAGTDAGTRTRVGAGAGAGAGAESETGADTKPVSGKGKSSVSEAEPGSEQQEGTGRKRQDRSWLLVALLVPLCVFIVVMLALGIVYCTSCAVNQNKGLTDCYRWVLPATSPQDNRTSKTGTCSNGQGGRD
ncbi:endosialin-like [Hypomesus transpacificus]|uniref:endosialin-like n=1 Tax=Hypomesus transpacificus TaxID=137520 RepID=UPI001F087E1D|nr:endosialin-like [Hypomesus transpacificus]